MKKLFKDNRIALYPRCKYCMNKKNGKCLRKTKYVCKFKPTWIKEKE